VIHFTFLTFISQIAIASFDLSQSFFCSNLNLLSHNQIIMIENHSIVFSSLIPHFFSYSTQNSTLITNAQAHLYALVCIISIS